MLFAIDHTTTYIYSRPVILEPHLLRLCPRSDAAQRVQFLEIGVEPAPLQRSPIADLDGNATVKVWFAPDLTTRLAVTVRSRVETLCTNPFNYLLEPWAQMLPIDYPASLLGQLQPYLLGPAWAPRLGIDAAVVTLAQDISAAVNGNVSQFLTELNQRIHDTCQYIVRDTGAPFPAGYTWSQRLGSCRDLTVLFMETCRAAGLAARFVSGYQCLVDTPDNYDFHLHAWAEVYLPGAGWRGFDPTQRAGAVGDRYIALAASAQPHYTAPLLGSFNQASGAQAQMSYTLTVQPLEVAVPSSFQSQSQSQ
jgi:transglutaminase-like putative cysteine protease